MPTQTVLLDTSYILALENRNDPHHDRAKAIDHSLLEKGATIVLHWGIILEIGDGYARLARRTKGLQVLKMLENEYSIYPITESLYRQSLGLYRSRIDKEWGLTDCVSFALMQREGITEALTADSHFRQAGFIAMLLD